MLNRSPVLLAEDDPNDVLFLRRAFEENQVLNPLQVVSNGEEAIQYLAGEGRFADRAAHPFPALFLLDLKMPVKDGLEVLRWLHQHPEIPSKLPVVVLSSTELPNETQMAYAMDIQACIVKPLSFSELREKVRILKEYWLDYEADAAGTVA
ncbi:MAG TPA: response regulator [Verrucomicrobiota bacterium]|jgi:CheY-like chemotaxis protein|nr:response regulator [Verrucomicrobiota bacterium]